MRTLQSPEARSATPRARWARGLDLALLGVAAAIAFALALVPYAGSDVRALSWSLRPSGWDIYGYVWETNVAGHASVATLGAKPGLPLLAALLSSVARVDAPALLAVLLPVLGASLGLASGALVRLTLRLPGWAAALVAFVVAAWAGTARVEIGYQPTLLLLVLLAAAVTIMVPARGRPAALLVAGALFAAACIAHAAEYAAFVGVAALYGALSLPGSIRARRAGAPLLSTDAGGVAATVLPGGAVGAAALFGWAGLRPAQTVHTAQISFLFTGRTYDLLATVRAKAVAGLGALGLAVAWRRGRQAADDALRSDRAGADSSALVRLGASWLAVVAVGVGLSLARFRIPGARLLLFGLPVPVVLGLGAAGAAGLALSARLPAPVRVTSGALVAALLAGSVAVPGLRALEAAIVPGRGPLAAPLEAAGAYLRTAGGSRPVVFVDDEPNAFGAYAGKLRVNQIRAGLPAGIAARAIVYQGTLANLLAGRPTLLGGRARWRRTYDENARASLAPALAALRAGAAVLVLRPIARPSFASVLAATPSRQIAPGVAVARGPILPGAASPPAPFPIPAAVATGIGLFAILALAGLGLVRVGLAHTDARAADLLALAPAAGAGALVLVSFVLAALGGDPHGAVGATLLAAVLLVSLWLARRPVGPSPSGRSAAP